ncbi:exonuclease [Ganoderma leucocontextum]|nr:exonuclease [Ganoderma leucocontextum]
MSPSRLLSTGVTANLSRTMRLRYLLILDFEATCDDTRRVVPRDESEIIEFPTLLYNVDENVVQDTFHEYVRPTRHPTLTSFCTDLTGIEQSTVDAADPFPSVWERYQEFLRKHDIMDQPGSAAYLTCGDWDLKTMLPQQLRLSGTQISPNSTTGTLSAPYNRWVNVKKSFQHHYGLKYAKGMAGMLKRAEMELEGRHHSGIDDCKNVLRIVQRMRKDGWKPWYDLPLAW